MDLVDVILLSVVEGITEFLPISSTGHLVLTAKLLGIPQTEFVKTFEIAIQSGAIGSIVFLYGRTLLKNVELLKKTLVAFLPTGIIGFTVYRAVKDLLIGNVTITLLSLMIGGIVLIGIELFFERSEKLKNSSRLSSNNKPYKLSAISYKQSLLIGLAQSISMVPGVSRAAATIIGGLFVGLNRKQATEFSFILAIPTMLTATGYDLLKSSSTITQSDIYYLAIGFITSFFVALAAVKWLLKFVQTNTFISFGIYRIILAILFFLFIQF